MIARRAIALAIAACVFVTVASVASGGPSATKQRIAIEGKLVLATNKGRWTLIPLSAGPLERDSGTLVGGGVIKPPIIRNGQRVTVVIGKDAHSGKNGNFIATQVVESVTAGRGAAAARGTWKFHGKTGVYKGVTGGGGFGSASPANSSILYSRQEGTVTIP